MKRKTLPSYPSERGDTVRRQIMSELKGQELSAREISARVSASEKDVYSHLEHIQRTAGSRRSALVITPAECRKCGFVFKKRERLKKPGKCPVCHGESIREPLFSITVSD